MANKYPPSKKQREIIADIEKYSDMRFTGQYSDEAYEFIGRAFHLAHIMAVSRSIREGMCRLADRHMEMMDDDIEMAFDDRTDPMWFRN